MILILLFFISRFIPDFTIEYEPDFRQAIAETWPRSLDDHESYEDWGWKYDITLDNLVKQTIQKIDNKYKHQRKIVGVWDEKASIYEEWKIECEKLIKEGIVSNG